MKKSVSNNHSKNRKVYEEAVNTLKKGVSIGNNPVINKYGKVQAPIPIYDLENKIVSWFVGITVRDRIVSFLQYDENINFIRYSEFLHKNESLERCPKAFTWLKPAYIKKLARTKVSPGYSLSTPFMTYDTNPSRIVWAVRASDNHNHKKTIFVAGTFVYVNSEKNGRYSQFE